MIGLSGLSQPVEWPPFIIALWIDNGRSAFSGMSHNWRSPSDDGDGRNDCSLVLRPLDAAMPDAMKYEESVTGIARPTIIVAAYRRHCGGNRGTATSDPTHHPIKSVIKADSISVFG